MGLIVDCARSGERGLFDLEGALDEEGSAHLKRRAVQLIATGCNELLLNLERVSTIHPAGLEALSRIEAMLPGSRAALTIAGPSSSIRSELERAGLGEFVEGAALDPSAELFGASALSRSA